MKTERRNRAHFVGVTASIMRRILVDYARRRHAAKRDAGSSATSDEAAGQHNRADEDAKLMVLDDALDRLEKLSPRQRQVVEMRHFGGLSLEETAEAIGVSTVTIKRDWLAARAWLRGQLQVTERTRQRALRSLYFAPLSPCRAASPKGEGFPPSPMGTLKMSERSSTGAPRACSGDIYAKVPNTAPWAARARLPGRVPLRSHTPSQ